MKIFFIVAFLRQLFYFFLQTYSFKLKNIVVITISSN
ncbi:Hypothetical Protein SLY_0139 [Strawberry lethal yellows phytoplasma (CPA) str. NZSb11]|uniref:Uncharacterized protein n=1 Tax=Strawberry lethal yellows phytoplasma (CPA) str. NZSb11 TaxID=980422 RepID=R4S001_PHYAS|nr:Hypothetical Protein SLY_0139 [Strawberry lethal yellows phytoplasma (CPA) str. NZSb11]